MYVMCIFYVMLCMYLCMLCLYKYIYIHIYILSRTIFCCVVSLIIPHYRMALARVFYHQPAFCVLDEATDAISAEAEANLYKILLDDCGVTCITIR